MSVDHVQATTRLLRERLGDRFAVFFDTPEGKRMPNGDVEESGRVINSDGLVFSYWYGWDEAAGTAALTEWEEVQPKESWLRRPAYVRARKSLGLPMPPRPDSSGA